MAAMVPCGLEVTFLTVELEYMGTNLHSFSILQLLFSSIFFFPDNFLSIHAGPLATAFLKSSPLYATTFIFN